MRNWSKPQNTLDREGILKMAWKFLKVVENLDWKFDFSQISAKYFLQSWLLSEGFYHWKIGPVFSNNLSDFWWGRTLSCSPPPGATGSYLIIQIICRFWKDYEDYSFQILKIKSNSLILLNRFARENTNQIRVIESG